jgi:Holliday junction resolvase
MTLIAVYAMELTRLNAYGQNSKKRHGSLTFWCQNTKRGAMSKAKQKGTAAETAVVKYLKEHGFPYAERRALHGTVDKGDITGCGPIVFEVKNHAKLDLAGWVKELEVEMDNATAATGSVIAKKRGTTDVGDWYAIMPTWVLVQLLKDAGY